MFNITTFCHGLPNNDFGALLGTWGKMFKNNYKYQYLLTKPSQVTQVLHCVEQTVHFILPSRRPLLATCGRTLSEILLHRAGKSHWATIWNRLSSLHLSMRLLWTLKSKVWVSTSYPNNTAKNVALSSSETHNIWEDINICSISFCSFQAKVIVCNQVHLIKIMIDDLITTYSVSGE